MMQIKICLEQKTCFYFVRHYHAAKLCACLISRLFQNLMKFADSLETWWKYCLSDKQLGSGRDTELHCVSSGSKLFEHLKSSRAKQVTKVQKVEKTLENIEKTSINVNFQNLIGQFSTFLHTRGSIQTVCHEYSRQRGLFKQNRIFVSPSWNHTTVCNKLHAYTHYVDPGQKAFLGASWLWSNPVLCWNDMR